MSNKPRPVSASEVFRLDGRGLPAQVHFPVIGNRGQIKIGAAFAYRSAAQAGLGHVLEVNVSNHDETWKQRWYERSETGQPDMYGHTEQKALLRMRLFPGLLIDLRGFHPPCPYENGCMNAMQILADKHRVDIVYHAEQEEKEAVYEFTWTGRRKRLGTKSR